MKFIVIAFLSLFFNAAFAMPDQVYDACLHPVQAAALAQAETDFPNRRLFTYYNSGLAVVSENPLVISTAVFEDLDDAIGTYAVTVNYSGDSCAAVSAKKISK